jgi:hypothetical protein
VGWLRGLRWQVSHRSTGAPRHVCVGIVHTVQGRRLASGSDVLALLSCGRVRDDPCGAGRRALPRGVAPGGGAFARSQAKEARIGDVRNLPRLVFPVVIAAKNGNPPIGGSSAWECTGPRDSPIRCRFASATFSSRSASTGAPSRPISCRGSDSTRSACRRDACELDDALSGRWTSSDTATATSGGSTVACPA